MKAEVQVFMVDLDRSNDYPLSFVCAFPKRQNRREKLRFSVKFLEQAAWKLLETSFRGPQKGKKMMKTRKELTKRLKVLKPTLTDKVIKTN